MADNKYLQWLAKDTPSIWWHDSAVMAEQKDAFANGAVGMTTNPFLVNATLRSDTESWREMVRRIDSGLTGDDRAFELAHCVTGYFAAVARPIFEKGEAGKGYVCAQTNPCDSGDTEKMVEQAKRIAAWAPNIVIKLPATAAGIRAYEECVALGFNVAATVGFTVPQVLAAAEARERGKKRAEQSGIQPGLAIAVLMVGRLDDYLRDIARDGCCNVRESDIIQAGTACIKRAYRIFAEKGYDAILMPAGCRGGYHITALSGAKMIMSIAPAIQKALLDEAVPFSRGIDEDVPSEVIERLMTMAEFRRAYEPDGIPPQEFMAYGATNRTLTQFIECGWKPLVAFRA